MIFKTKSFAHPAYQFQYGVHVDVGDWYAIVYHGKSLTRIDLEKWERRLVYWKLRAVLHGWKRQIHRERRSFVKGVGGSKIRKWRRFRVAEWGGPWISVGLNQLTDGRLEPVFGWWEFWMAKKGYEQAGQTHSR